MVTNGAAPPSEKLITTLAILKVNADRGSDYIDYFVPFVAECLRTSIDDVVSLADVRDELVRRFGISIPLGALKTILKRAARKGYLRKENETYRRVSAQLANLDFSRIREDALRQETALVAKLVEFSKRRFDFDWADERAEAALLAHLETRSAMLLAAITSGVAVPTPIETSASEDFAVSVFILNLADTDPEGFGYLETLVKGSALASVMFFPELANVTSSFTGLTVFLDTRVLLRALGLEGDSAREVVTEMLDLVYELGGRIACFDETYAEMRGVLVGLKGSLKTGVPSPGDFPGSSTDYLRKSGASPSDIDLRLAHLDEDLSAFRIQVRKRPTGGVQVNQEGLRACLRDEVRYRRENALEHDLLAVEAILRLRGGERQFRLETSRAVFVTTNTSLVRAARSFAGYQPDCIPLLFADSEFVTLVWLKRPLAFPDLPTKQVIANSYAGLNPSEILWKAYLDEIDRLRDHGGLSSDDYYILRYAAVASSALMDLTIGDIEAFTEGTIHEVLDRAQAAVKAETVAELQREVRTRERAEVRVSSIVQDVTAERDRRYLRYRRRSIQLARALRILVTIIVLPILAIGLWISTPLVPQLNDDQTLAVRPILIVCVLAVYIVSISGIWNSVSLKGRLLKFEGDASRRIEKRLIHMFEDDGIDEPREAA